MGLLQVGGGPFYRNSHLEADSQGEIAALDFNRIQFTRKEFELLAYLVKNAGEVVPRQALLLNIWGYGDQIRTRTLDVHIRRLRKKLGDDRARCIQTVFGVGYRFQSADRRI